MKKRVLILAVSLLVFFVTVGGVLLGKHLFDLKNTAQSQEEPIGDSEQTENDKTQPNDKPEQDQEEIVPPSGGTSSKVEIPVANETSGLQFPCEVPGHNLRIEKLGPYTGIFVEDGTNQQVPDVAMLLVKNTGDSAVEYAEIT